jgi:UDP:flavonoid glycosyltransferase YjiC (YdhE family)
MKIAWFCIPAHGHTNPTLGIVRELTATGHKVYYFSFEMFREKIEQAGAVLISCDGYDFEMEDKGHADRVGKDKAFATELLVSSTLALDDMTTEKIREIKPDLVVSDSVAFWGKLAAMKHGLPYVSSTTTFAFNRFSAKYMYVIVAISFTIKPFATLCTKLLEIQKPVIYRHRVLHFRINIKKRPNSPCPGVMINYIYEFGVHQSYKP